jgi:hypothetical protein
MPPEGDHVLLAVDVGRERRLDGVKEVCTILACLKSDDVAAEQSIKHFRSPGTDLEHARRRPGDVPEGHHRARGKPASEHPRGEREVIVLHQYEGRGARGFLADGCDEACIRELIHPEVGGSENRLNVHGMAQRPESLIRKAVVVPAVLVVWQPHIAETVLRIGGRHVQSTAIVGTRCVGVPGTMCHPYSGTGFDERLEGRHEAARGAFQADPTISRTFVCEWRAIREHDDALPRV